MLMSRRLECHSHTVHNDSLPINHSGLPSRGCSCAGWSRAQGCAGGCSGTEGTPQVTLWWAIGRALHHTAAISLAVLQERGCPCDARHPISGCAPLAPWETPHQQFPRPPNRSGPPSCPRVPLCIPHLRVMSRRDPARGPWENAHPHAPSPRHISRSDSTGARNRFYTAGTAPASLPAHEGAVRGDGPQSCACAPEPRAQARCVDQTAQAGGRRAAQAQCGAGLHVAEGPAAAAGRAAGPGGAGPGRVGPGLRPRARRGVAAGNCQSQGSPRCQQPLRAGEGRRGLGRVVL